MKKLILSILILFSIVAISCSSANKEKLIKDYEQTIDSHTKIDLSLKVKELNLINKVTVEDSIKIFLNQFKARFRDCPQNIRDLLSQCKKELNGGEKALDSMKIKVAKLKMEGEGYQYLQNVIDKYEPSINLMIKARDFLDKNIDYPSKTIGNKWKCVYTIINPMLNNAKQEITRIYIFNEDNSKIITKLTD